MFCLENIQRTVYMLSHLTCIQRKIGSSWPTSTDKNKHMRLVLEMSLLTKCREVNTQKPEYRIQVKNINVNDLLIIIFRVQHPYYFQDQLYIQVKKLKRCLNVQKL